MRILANRHRVGRLGLLVGIRFCKFARVEANILQCLLGSPEESMAVYHSGEPGFAPLFALGRVYAHDGGLQIH